MKLSIITCTYNSEKYLQECIDSVIAQDLNVEDYEHIFVDAYSTDNIKMIIEKYMKKYSNVRLIERKPKWVYNAMNEGIKVAQWEYIMCLNSDDFLECDVLEWYLKFIYDNWKKDLYYAKLNIFDNWVIKYWENGRLLTVKRILFNWFWSNVLIYHPTVIAKKSTIIEMWLFDENKIIASDFWMWLKMNCEGKNFCFFPKNATYYRSRDWSLSSRNVSLWEDEVIYYQKKYLPKYRFYIARIIDKILVIYVKIILFIRKSILF